MWRRNGNQRVFCLNLLYPFVDNFSHAQIASMLMEHGTHTCYCWRKQEQHIICHLLCTNTYEYIEAASQIQEPQINDTFLAQDSRNYHWISYQIIQKLRLTMELMKKFAEMLPSIYKRAKRIIILALMSAIFPFFNFMKVNISKSDFEQNTLAYFVISNHLFLFIAWHRYFTSIPSRTLFRSILYYAYNIWSPTLDSARKQMHENIVRSVDIFAIWNGHVCSVYRAFSGTFVVWCFQTIGKLFKS